MIIKTMPFTTPDGVEHPNAVWRLVGLYATLNGLRIVIYGYHNMMTYEAGAQPLSGAVKEYSLPASTISSHGELETAIHLAAWETVTAIKDVGVAPSEGEEDTRQSFFAAAVAAA
jgi:hypothetical protein